MKKIYLIFLTIIACAFLASTDAGAQEFPWPDDLGTPMVIEPGDPGVFDQTINGDTAADGSRLHQHYILKRGELYLYIYDVNNVGWDLMVTAEEGEGPLPILMALGTPPGGDEALRPFTCQGNVYLKGLNVRGWANDAKPTDNATVRLNADSLTGVIKDCIFDYNRQNSFRMNGDHCKFYMENTLVYGQGTASNVANGESLHFRGNFAAMVHFRNNTYVNMTDQFCDNLPDKGKRYATFIVDHNTIVNTGRHGAELGRPDSLVWTNNLIINPMVLGTGWDGDRDRYVEDLYAFYLDSNFVETIVGDDTSYVFEQPNVTFENNWIYVDPDVTAFLPDSSDGADLFMFDPLLDDVVKAEATNMIIKEAFPFTDAAANTTADYQAFIVDYYTIPETPADLPGFAGPHNAPRTEPTEADFGYATSHAAYTGAADGKPLGDLNWHDLSSGIWDKLEQVNMKIFPNPVGDYFVISLDVEMNRLDIVNVLGQRVLQTNVAANREALVNSSDLEKGLYIVRCYNNNKLLGTHKIMK